MTDGPVEWVEDNIDTDAIDPFERPQDYFKNWWSFAEGTKRDIQDLFARGRFEDVEDRPVEQRIMEFFRSVFDPRRW